MKLELRRESTPHPTAIRGSLTVDGAFEAYTLEGAKVAIPAGVYTIEMTHSPKFQRLLPLLDGVAGRSAIRIHPGNTVADTEGCILVGTGRTDIVLTNSRLASDSLNEKILSAIGAGETVTITVKD